MDTVNYFDRRHASKSSISFGQFMVSVNIDGLPAVNFYQSGAADHGVGNDVTSLVRRHSTSSVITLLGMRDSDEWHIELNDDQTMARMEEIFREAGLLACMGAVKRLKKDRVEGQTLTQFWKQTLQPGIARDAEAAQEHLVPAYKSTMSKAHPANSRRKLHPKAESFLEYELPAQIEKHLKMVDGKIVKSA